MSVAKKKKMNTALWGEALCWVMMENQGEIMKHRPSLLKNKPGKLNQELSTIQFSHLSEQTAAGTPCWTGNCFLNYSALSEGNTSSVMKRHNFQSSSGNCFRLLRIFVGSVLPTLDYIWENFSCLNACWTIKKSTSSLASHCCCNIFSKRCMEYMEKCILLVPLQISIWQTLILQRVGWFLLTMLHRRCLKALSFLKVGRREKKIMSIA